MGRQRVVRERRRGLADALRKFPAVAQQLQLPKASAGLRARSAALAGFVWLRRHWELALGVALIVGAALVGHFGDGGRR